MIPEVPEAILDDKNIVKSNDDSLAQKESSTKSEGNEGDKSNSYFTTPDGRSYTGDLFFYYWILKNNNFWPSILKQSKI